MQMFVCNPGVFWPPLSQCSIVASRKNIRTSFLLSMVKLHSIWDQPGGESKPESFVLWFKIPSASLLGRIPRRGCSVFRRLASVCVSQPSHSAPWCRRTARHLLPPRSAGPVGPAPVEALPLPLGAREWWTPKAAPGECTCTVMLRLPFVLWY